MSENFVWLRIGDQDYYESYDSPYEAGIVVGKVLLQYDYKIEDIKKRKTGGGIEVGEFSGYNYISLYIGDEEGAWIKGIKSK